MWKYEHRVVCCVAALEILNWWHVSYETDRESLDCFKSQRKNQLCICVLLRETWRSALYPLTNLCCLDDSEVIHAGYACTHGCSQTCCTKLHPGRETFPQSLHCSFFYQLLHHWNGLGILETEKYVPSSTEKNDFFSFCFLECQMAIFNSLWQVVLSEILHLVRSVNLYHTLTCKFKK